MVLPAAEDILPAVVEAVPVDTAPVVVEVVLAVDSAEAVLPVVEVAPVADSMVAARLESAAADPVDIDMASFEEALLDFENRPTRACPAVMKVAESARWDRID